MTPKPELECLNAGGSTECRGPVELHSVDPGRERAWPRCERHWADRLDDHQNSISRWAHSDVAPDWFDPADAGERWDDDY